MGCSYIKGFSITTKEGLHKKYKNVIQRKNAEIWNILTKYSNSKR